jgi:glycosyltransferase 2 family protein
MGRVVQMIISVGLTALIGWLIYRQVPDWGQSFHVMIQGSASLFLAGLCFVTLHVLLRAARWGVLLKTSKANISFKNLLSLTLIKYVLNIIPPRTGEVAASIVLAKKEQIPAATVIAASVFERILDTIAVLVWFACYLLFFSTQFPPHSETGQNIILGVRNYSIKGFALLGIGLAILVFLLRRAHWAEHIPLKIRKPVLHFLEGFRALQSHGTMLRVFLLSLAIWLTIIMQLWCFVLAYVRPFPLAGALLLMALTVVGVAIPTPAGVGGFQYFMNLGLINFFWQYLSLQDPRSQAAGISNGCYMASIFPILIAGLVFLNKEGLSLARIFRATGETPENKPANS